MQTSPVIPSVASENAAPTEFRIRGMTCSNCARHVTDAIQSVAGVRSASVLLEAGHATVHWNPDAPPDTSAVIAAVQAGGYEAEEVAAETTELLVSGMTCSNCARHVTEAIQSVPGVRQASVTLETGRATVRWSEGAQRNVLAILSAIAAAGYAARPSETAGPGEQRQSRWQWNLLLGLVVTTVLMAGEWIFQLSMTPWFRWFSFALAGAVQIFAGAQFYRGAWRQLKVGSSNMDTLVALGSTTAFGYSAWALLSGAGGHLYFMEAAAIITLISAGHWSEARVSDRASSALKSLLRLAPQTARKIQKTEDGSQRSEVRGQRSDQEFLNLKTLSFAHSALHAPHPTTEKSSIEQVVPLSELQIGDHVALLPGDRVPVDGMVLDGESSVDEAMLTGESFPIDKQSGAELFAGTVNLNGRLVMRVTGTGESTALAQVITAVQRAQTSRADIQRLGDRVSSVFVPVVVAIALAAGLWWGLAPQSAKYFHDLLAPFLWPARLPAGLAAGFVIAAAVLIIACPCAMGLATPAAIMAAANAAVRRGILIRDGVALEKAGKISAVIFDKTGTLTAGRPEVAEVWCRTGIAPVSGSNNVEKLAAALARNSTHPVSQAIARISTEKIELTGWTEIRGCGVTAILPPSTFNPQPSTKLGSLRWLKESGVDLSAGEKFISTWSGQGATIVGLASGETLLGLFAVRDTVKPNAGQVIGQLQRMGLKIYLITGDNTLTAISIARQIGIPPENVFAEIRPEQKAEFVKKLQARGEIFPKASRLEPLNQPQDEAFSLSRPGGQRAGVRGLSSDIRTAPVHGEGVAFVGDGINDAPALTQADLGIAVSRASDIAREAADIILLKSEIDAVPEALGLARAALRTIKQNLFWAFFYNAVGVPLAAFGFISPILCAAAMGVSDLIVIGNALRLLRWKQ